MINWNDLNKDDVNAIQRIGKRAVTEYPDFDFLDLTMDISAVHIKNPLDLEKLESADGFNFAHDIFGMARHIDRNTGDLKDCFLPRCSAPQEANP